MKTYKKITLDGLEEKYFNQDVPKGLFLSGPIYKNKQKVFINCNSHEKNIIKLSQDLMLETNFFKFSFFDSTTLVIGTDQFRSLPVYFSYINHELEIFYKSNSFKKKKFKFIKHKIKELESSGATIGRNSIAKGFFSLNPGEMLAIDLKNKTFQIKKYFQFKYKFKSECKDDNFEKLEMIFDNIFTSLKSKVKGRRVLIPLSGGYDSRLIACELKKHEFDNLLAFSYGSSKNSAEAIISKKIADSLGIPWLFIGYKNKSWNKQSNNDFANYLYSAFDFSSLPHYQDYLAVYIGITEGLINSDDIIMPGHSGDMLAGSHFLKLKDHEYYHSLDISKMLERDIFNFKKNNLARTINYHLSRDIKLYQEEGIKFQIDAMRLDFELRQAKYIINSVRVYEHFDLDWWLPLWDIRLVNHFLSLSKNHLIKAEYYDKFVNKTYIDLVNNKKTVPHNERTKLKTLIKNFEISFLKGLSKYTTYTNVKSYRKFFFSSLGYRGLLSFGESLKILNGNTHQSLIIKKIIKKLHK